MRNGWMIFFGIVGLLVGPQQGAGASFSGCAEQLGAFRSQLTAAEFTAARKWVGSKRRRALRELAALLVNLEVDLKGEFGPRYLSLIQNAAVAKNEKAFTLLTDGVRAATQLTRGSTISVGASVRAQMGWSAMPVYWNYPETVFIWEAIRKVPLWRNEYGRLTGYLTVPVGTLEIRLPVDERGVSLVLSEHGTDVGRGVTVVVKSIDDFASDEHPTYTYTNGVPVRFDGRIFNLAGVSLQYIHLNEANRVWTPGSSTLKGYKNRAVFKRALAVAATEEVSALPVSVDLAPYLLQPVKPVSYAGLDVLPKLLQVAMFYDDPVEYGYLPLESKKSPYDVDDKLHRGSVSWMFLRTEGERTFLLVPLITERHEIRTVEVSVDATILWKWEHMDLYREEGDRANANLRAISRWVKKRSTQLDPLQVIALSRLYKPYHWYSPDGSHYAASWPSKDPYSWEAAVPQKMNMHGTKIYTPQPGHGVRLFFEMIKSMSRPPTREEYFTLLHIANEFSARLSRSAEKTHPHLVREVGLLVQRMFPNEASAYPVADSHERHTLFDLQSFREETSPKEKPEENERESARPFSDPFAAGWN